MGRAGAGDTTSVRPMMALPAGSLPVGGDWSYEVKWDGYRAQAVKDGDRVVLRSRNLKDITAQFPEVADAVAAANARRAVIDGEIVALDRRGHPSFQALHHWATAGLAIAYYAFDILSLEGRDLTQLPLDERRGILSRVVKDTPILLSEPLPGTPASIERAVRRAGLEGVVAKRRSSPYEPGKRSGAWMKVKFGHRQEFVVGGYNPDAKRFDSILVGYYEGSRLMSAGKVRSGFTPHTRAVLFERLEPLATATCPFANLPSSRSSHWGEGVTPEEMRELRWARPVVVVEVAFTEWTRDGNLRHAAYLGIRDDKSPRDVRRERISGRPTGVSPG